MLGAARKQAEEIARINVQMPEGKEGMIFKLMQTVKEKLDAYALKCKAMVKTEPAKEKEEKKTAANRKPSQYPLSDFFDKVNEERERQRQGAVLKYVRFNLDLPPLDDPEELKYRDVENPSRSRYRNEFEEVKKIGGGHTYLVKNKMDLLLYVVRKAWIEEINPLEESCSETEEADPSPVPGDMSPVEFIREPKSEHLLTEECASGSSPESESPVEDLHESLVKEGIGEVVKIICLQMEYVEGITLRSYIQSKPIVPTDERWKLFRQILEAIAYSHSKDVVHGDLRPENIYITKDGSIKLANFAIGVSALRKKDPAHATALGVSSILEQKSTPLLRHQSSNGAKKLTYRSPEYLKGEGLVDKSDIYSLGIILFEMSYPLSTAEKRETVLSTLRKRFEFPIDLDTLVDEPKEVRDLVLQCLATDPSDRPSALTLLESDLLPRRIEDEEFNKFIRTIKNPKTMESQKLMSNLFLRGNSPEIEFTDDDPEIHSIRPKREPDQFEMDEKLRPVLKGRLVQIFQRHCAGCIEPNLFYPYNQYKTIFVGAKAAKTKIVDLRKSPAKGQTCIRTLIKDSIINPAGTPSIKVIKYVSDIPQQDIHVKLLDPQRLLLQAAYSMHVPWARVFAQSYSGSCRPIKRYAFGNIYSYFEHGMKLHPHCCFDITSEAGYDSRTESLHEAEVLKVTDEIFAELYGKDRYKIRVNSTHLLDCVLVACGAKAAIRPKLYQYIRKEVKLVHGKKVLISEVAVKEITKKFNMSRTKQLAAFLNILTNSPTELEEKVLAIFPKIKLSISWSHAMNQLQRLYTFCEGFKINMNRMVLDPSLMPDDGLVYHSGLYFTVMTSPKSKGRLGRSTGDKVLAVGGRFDNTLHLYATPEKPLFGVGVDISSELVARGFYEMTQVNNNGILISFKRALKGEGQAQMKECVTIMCEIWKRGLLAAADFFINQEIEDWLKYCQRNDYKKFAIVSLKAKEDKDSSPQFSLLVVDVSTHKKEKEEVLKDIDALEESLIKYAFTMQRDPT